MSEELSDEELEQLRLKLRLIRVASEGHVEVMRILLDAGAKPDAVVDGDTVLTWAKRGGCAEAVALLEAALAKSPPRTQRRSVRRPKPARLPMANAAPPDFSAAGHTEEF